MPSSNTLKGKEAMIAKIKRIQKNFPLEVDAALYQETEVELKEVKRRTPVDKGELRASEHIEGPIREGRKTFCRVVAGGPAAPYALYVHEDLDAFHKVGQAKYIESVILESRPYMAARVAKRIDLNRAMNS